jgi:hypothetical protein
MKKSKERKEVIAMSSPSYDKRGNVRLTSLAACAG